MKIFGVQAEILYAIHSLKDIGRALGTPLRVSSVVRPYDMKRFTLHFDGYAADLVLVSTTEDDNAAYWRIVQNFQAEGWDEYQLLVHNEGTGLHIHVEYDPSNSPKWGGIKHAMKLRWTTWVGIEKARRGSDGTSA